MNVLLVEDDASMRSTLERTLARRGFHLTACGDGRQALALWKSGRPDVVMLDLSLPGSTGWRCCSKPAIAAWPRPC